MECLKDIIKHKEIKFNFRGKTQEELLSMSLELQNYAKLDQGEHYKRI